MSSPCYGAVTHHGISLLMSFIVAPVCAHPPNVRGNRIMRARLIPVTVRPCRAEQAIDQNTRAGALIAIDHDTGGIGQRRAHGRLGAQSLEALVAGSEYDSLHPPISRHQYEPGRHER